MFLLTPFFKISKDNYLLEGGMFLALKATKIQFRTS